MGRSVVCQLCQFCYAWSGKRRMEFIPGGHGNENITYSHVSTCYHLSLCGSLIYTIILSRQKCMLNLPYRYFYINSVHIWVTFGEDWWKVVTCILLKTYSHTEKQITFHDVLDDAINTVVYKCGHTPIVQRRVEWSFLKLFRVIGKMWQIHWYCPHKVRLQPNSTGSYRSLLLRTYCDVIIDVIVIKILSRMICVWSFHISFQMVAILEK